MISPRRKIMVLFVHNPTVRQSVLASFLFLLLSLSAFAQDTPSALEAALATTEPAGRIEALQKFLQTAPDTVQAETARAELTRSFAYLGETDLAAKNIEAALQNFKQAVAAFPQKTDDKFFDEVAIKIPLAVSVRGYRTEAILLAREIEARFASEAKRLTSLGEFYLSVEAPSEALRALHTAVKLAPDNARIYRTFGAAYRVNLNLEEAAAQYQKAIKADPKDARAYFELGNLHRARGNYELAINLYNHQLSLEPEHVPSLKGLALCYLAQDKEERAAQLLAQAAKVTNADLKQDFYFQTQLAMTYLARGKTSQARLAADAALVAEPRFSWGRIAAAEVDLAENQYFESERNIIAAMKYANFPSLHFLLGKIYLAVEDFEGALVEFNKAFSFKGEQFQTRLGGAVEAKAASVAALLAPERQASLFQAEPITNEVEFKLAENLVRFEDAIHGARQSSSALLSAILINQTAKKNAVAHLQKSTEAFVETEGSRKSFRWLYAAERLTQTGQALETVLRLTTQALDAAEAATAPEGSLRDYPNYDRDGRLRVFRGRTLTIRGRALIKLGRAAEAVATLEEAVEHYDLIPERKRAQWQLAAAKESAGQTKEALDLYIAAYEPPEKAALNSDLNRAVIESLYSKLHGSLAGLNERIGKARETSLLASSAPKSAAPLFTPETTAPSSQAEAKPVENLPTEVTAPPPMAISDAAKTATVVTPEVAPAAKAELPITLPEARLQALVVGEITQTEINPEIALAPDDAFPPAAAVATHTDKPVSATKTLAALVVLPASKSLSLALSPAELAQTGLQQEFDLSTEDAALLLTAPPPAEVATASEKTRSLEIAAPIALPVAPVISPTLLLTLAETSSKFPAFAWSLAETDDPALVVTTSAKAEAETVPPQTQLSDSRVAEIEKSINKGTSGGKKGDSSNAREESVSGHIEGDVPIRIGRPLEPVLPSGESGHIADTTPKATNANSEDKSKELPAEVEQRAKTMGQSAGKLSVGAAMEIEAPDKPAGGGRKGIVNPTGTADKAASGARPRRVKETEKSTEDPPMDKKKPNNP